MSFCSLPRGSSLLVIALSLSTGSLSGKLLQYVILLPIVDKDMISSKGLYSSIVQPFVQPGKKMNSPFC